jgi:hypothetical protein
MTLMRRIGAALAAVVLPLALAGCGINDIPTKQETAKAKWGDVQADYQRRADLIPNLVATVQAYAIQERTVLTDVISARAKATSVTIDASKLDDPAAFQRFPASPGRAFGLARPAAGGQRELPEPEVQRELPGAAVAAGGHGEPHRDRAARLQRRRARLQHDAEGAADLAVGAHVLLVG